jgi:hypothetical protein
VARRPRRFVGAGRRNGRKRRRRVIRWSKASPTRRLLRHGSFPVLFVAIQTVVDCELGWIPFIAAAVACDRTGFGVQFLSRGRSASRCPRRQGGRRSCGWREGVSGLYRTPGGQHRICECVSASQGREEDTDIQLVSNATTSISTQIIDINQLVSVDPNGITALVLEDQAFILNRKSVMRQRPALSAA